MESKFSTTDLGLAAWILATGKMRLLAIERIPDKHRNTAVISFSDPDYLGMGLQLDYYAGNGLVCPLEFYSEIRNLKRKVYAACVSSNSEAR